MSDYPDQAAAVADALAELDVHPDDRILIMLPDGPEFAAAFADVIQHGAVPLPVNPLLPAHDVMAVADEAGARLVLAPVDRIAALTALGAKPPVLVSGAQGSWTALLRLR